MLQIFLLELTLAVVFVLVNMACLRATDASLQSEPCHSLCVCVLKACEVVTGHDVVGTQPRPSFGFGAVTLLYLRLARFLLSLGGYDWHDRNMEVRCLLVHVQMRPDNIRFAECLLHPFDTRLRPIVEAAFVGKSSQGIAVGCQQDMEGKHLVLADLACKPGMVKPMLDCLAQTADTIRVSDEVVPVEMSQFGMGVVGLGASLDMSGDCVAGTACLHDVEYSVTHRQACFCRGTIAVYGFL